MSYIEFPRHKLKEYEFLSFPSPVPLRIFSFPSPLSFAMLTLIQLWYGERAGKRFAYTFTNDDSTSDCVHGLRNSLPTLRPEDEIIETGEECCLGSTSTRWWRGWMSVMRAWGTSSETPRVFIASHLVTRPWRSRSRRQWNGVEANRCSGLLMSEFD